MLGKVNLLGLNSLGQNPGMSPIFGLLIGAGTSYGGGKILSKTGATAHPELFSLLGGLAVSGVMYAMRATRHAALYSALGAVLTSGLAWLDRAIMPRLGLGIPSVRSLNGLGVPMVRSLNGMGIPSMSAVHAPVGIAGNQLSNGSGLSAPPVSLLGPVSPQAASLRSSGGPPVHGLSAAYGATLLGGGR